MAKVIVVRKKPITVVVKNNRVVPKMANVKLISHAAKTLVKAVMAKIVVPRAIVMVRKTVQMVAVI